MHKFMRKQPVSVFPAFIMVWTLSCTCFADQKPAKPNALQPAPRKVAFIAEVEMSQDSSATNFSQEKLVYDNGRFRTLTIFPEQKGYRLPKGYKPVKWYNLYDGNSSRIVWSLMGKDHPAAPSLESCMYILTSLVQRDGMAAIMKRFHLPSSAERVMRTRPEALPFPYSVITMLIVPPSDARLIGAGKMVGRSCSIYAENIRHGEGRNAIQFVTKYWVDRHTGLVLREETTITPPPVSPMPRTHSLFAVLWLHQVHSLPHALFVLPPGTKVMIPETCGKVTLPPGVKRVAYPAQVAACGFGF